MQTFKSITRLTSLVLLLVVPAARAQKPPLTLDDFFNSVEIRSLQISPDGHEVVIETVRPDWPGNRFRDDLWLYCDAGGGSLVQITQSGHDGGAQWSPDGRSIAFLSDRKVANAEPKVPNRREQEDIENTVAQVYVVSARGGEAFPVTFGDENVHSFAWSADSHRIYFATRNRWMEQQKDEPRKEWSDVVQFRESERGDTVFGIGSSLRSASHHDQRKSTGATRAGYSRCYSVPSRPDGCFARRPFIGVHNRLAFRTHRVICTLWHLRDRSTERRSATPGPPYSRSRGHLGFCLRRLVSRQPPDLFFVRFWHTRRSY